MQLHFSVVFLIAESKSLQGTHKLGPGHAMCGGTDQRWPLRAIDASEQGHLQHEVIHTAQELKWIYAMYLYIIFYNAL